MEYFHTGQIPVPDNKNYEYAYNESFKIAKERLLNIKDLTRLCQNAGAECLVCDKFTAISLTYLGQIYEIRLPEITFTIKNSDVQIPIRDRILLLHYLLTAKGTSLSGVPITFKELPEGIVYFRTFQQRTIRHLINHFGNDPEKLIQAGLKLGGTRAEGGDSAVTIQALPRVPITFLVWRGDDEFPAEASLLYDRTITDYLPTEDIIVLSEALTWKLVRNV